MKNNTQREQSPSSSSVSSQSSLSSLSSSSSNSSHSVEKDFKTMAKEKNMMRMKQKKQESLLNFTNSTDASTVYEEPIKKSNLKFNVSEIKFDQNFEDSLAMEIKQIKTTVLKDAFQCEEQPNCDLNQRFLDFLNDVKEPENSRNCHNKNNNELTYHQMEFSPSLFDFSIPSLSISCDDTFIP